MGWLYITDLKVIPSPITHTENDLEYLLSIKQYFQKKMIYLLKAWQEKLPRCREAINLPRKSKQNFTDNRFDIE